MTATVAAYPDAAAAPRVSVARGYRFELVKLVSQWRIRLLVLACWIAPAALRRRRESAEFAPRRHALRPLDARHGMGRFAGGPRILGHLGAPAADFGGRR